MVTTVAAAASYPLAYMVHSLVVNVLMPPTSWGPDEEAEAAETDGRSATTATVPSLIRSQDPYHWFLTASDFLGGYLWISGRGDHTAPSARQDLEGMLIAIRKYASELVPDDRTRFLDAWGMSGESAFLNRSYMTNGGSSGATQETQGTDDTLMDEILCFLETVRRRAKIEVQSMQTKRYGPEQIKRRLIYLFHIDLMIGRGVEILENKDRYDAVMSSELERGQTVLTNAISVLSEVSITRKLCVWTLVLGLNAGMIAYLVTFAYTQTRQRQLAWFRGVLAWVCLDIIMISTMDVLLTHLAVPSYVSRQLGRVKRKALSFFVKKYSRIATAVSLTDDLKDPTKDGTIVPFSSFTSSSSPGGRRPNRSLPGWLQPAPPPEPFNMCEYLFVSYKVAQNFPSILESDLIRMYSTPWPPLLRYRLRQKRGVVIGGDDDEARSLRDAVSQDETYNFWYRCVGSIKSCSRTARALSCTDFVLEVSIFSIRVAGILSAILSYWIFCVLGGGVLYFHVWIYDQQPALAIVPISALVATVILLGVLSSSDIVISDRVRSILPQNLFPSNEGNIFYRMQTQLRLQVRKTFPISAPTSAFVAEAPGAASTKPRQENAKISGATTASNMNARPAATSAIAGFERLVKSFKALRPTAVDTAVSSLQRTKEDMLEAPASPLAAVGASPATSNGLISTTTFAAAAGNTEQSALFIRRKPLASANRYFNAPSLRKVASESDGTERAGLASANKFPFGNQTPTTLNPNVTVAVAPSANTQALSNDESLATTRLLSASREETTAEREVLNSSKSPSIPAAYSSAQRASAVNRAPMTRTAKYQPSVAMAVPISTTPLDECSSAAPKRRRHIGNSATSPAANTTATVAAVRGGGGVHGASTAARRAAMIYTSGSAASAAAAAAAAAAPSAGLNAGRGSPGKRPRPGVNRVNANHDEM